MKVLTEADSKTARNVPAFPAMPRSERETQNQPAFSVAFTPSTPMKEIHDAVIQTVLRYTHGNRSRAAELLQINPRTIRRHLGRKETPHATALAG
jgi:DNA-binding NtrC family response regulator